MQIEQRRTETGSRVNSPNEVPFQKCKNRTALIKAVEIVEINRIAGQLDRNCANKESDDFISFPQTREAAQRDYIALFIM